MQNVSKSQHSVLSKMSASIDWKTSCIKFAVNLATVCFISNVIAEVADQFNDYLLCRKCGHEVVRVTNLISQPSKLAHRQRNDTIGAAKGVLIQLFENPHGVKFEVITSTMAEVHVTEPAVAADSWFPGYKWKIIYCPHCGYHLGWEFLPTDTSDKEHESHHFFGLVYNNLLYQNDADNLIIIPKSYTS